MAKAQAQTQVKVKDPETGKDIKVELGSLHAPLPWAEPYPASKVNEKGEEQVFVKVTLLQDVIVNGVKMAAGPQTVGAGFAHQHAAVLVGQRE